MSDNRNTNDDLHDAVTDRLLAEAVGGETPPDQREAILQRSVASTPARAEGSFRRWTVLATAASLLIVASATLLLPQAGEQQREVSKRTELVSDQDASPREFRSATQFEGQPTSGEPPVVVYNDASGVVSSVEQPASSKQPLQMGVVPRIIEGRDPSSTPQAAAEAIVPSNSESAADTFIVQDRLEESSTLRPASPAAAPPQPLASAAPGRGQTAAGRQFAAGRAGQPNSIAYSEFYAGAPIRGLGREGVPVTPLPRFRRAPGEQFGTERSVGDRYQSIAENPFIAPRGEDALSTFSVDVDTASYANVRQFLQQMRRLPPPDAVRIEELVNYFEYDYPAPNESDEAPFAADIEVAGCPWAPKHRLVRIGVKGREVEAEKRPLSNLVFLVDVSGSMQNANKLPLLVSGLKRLTRRLGENDRVAIVVYASSEGVALPSTSGSERGTILAALDNLRAGGSTAGGAGIQLAYEIAEQNFIEGGVNRVLLCTDGDFNVGVTNTDALADLVEIKAKETGVFLSVLGFGRGNLNDAMMEAVSGRGNGVYAYIDSDREAHRVLVRQMSGTLVTIAKDVKLQVEFNPQHVARYRLIGYENRILAAQDFNDDTKDAGEIGAGHTVTALYEIVPTGVVGDGDIDELKYQAVEEPAADPEPPIAPSPEMLTLKVRYKQPDGDVSTKLEFPLVDNGAGLGEASADFRFASAVAEFGLLLRNSPHKGSASYGSLIERAEANVGQDAHGDRAEFVGLARQAAELQGRVR